MKVRDPVTVWWLADQVKLLDRRSKSGWEAHARSPLAYPYVQGHFDVPRKSLSPGRVMSSNHPTAEHPAPRPDEPASGALSSAEANALARALDLAVSPGTSLGPNPQVGCVLLDRTGATVAEGFHRGAGHPHAEAEALANLPPGSRPHTAVVTLEPCRHVGRTPPCATALIDAGVSRVVIGCLDPTPEAGGGAAVMRQAGLEVTSDVPPELAARAAALIEPWQFGLAHRRPMVTWKVASTLDGRSAAADGTSQWITSAASRRDVHRLRALHDVIMVGTGTALVDDPALSVRDADGVPAPHQPLRVVMGMRPIPPHYQIHQGPTPARFFTTRDPHAVLEELFAAGKRRVFLEGGSALAAAFLRVGLIDEIVAYVAPVVLGAGAPIIGSLGIDTISSAKRFRIQNIAVIGADTPVGTAGAPRSADDEPNRAGDPPNRTGTFDSSDLDVRITMRPHRSAPSDCSAPSKHSDPSDRSSAATQAKQDTHVHRTR